VKQMRRVAMADLAVATAPTVLITIGLGSCIGVALYDNKARVGGLAHVMLPQSNGTNISNPAKFADTALPLLVSKMKDHGALTRRLTAKIAGGAQMFRLDRPTETMRIGERNTEAVMKWLESARIPVLGQATGGSWGRTVELNTETGEFLVRTIAHGEQRF
jgi:chemotaxis protein CheD